MNIEEKEYFITYTEKGYLSTRNRIIKAISATEALREFNIIHKFVSTKVLDIKKI